MARIHSITHLLMIDSFDSTRIPNLVIKPQINGENGAIILNTFVLVKQAWKAIS